VLNIFMPGPGMSLTASETWISLLLRPERQNCDQKTSLVVNLAFPMGR
jgi:hypothetical protein